MSDAAGAKASPPAPFRVTLDRFAPLLLCGLLGLLGLVAIGTPSTWLTLTVAGLAMGALIFIIASGLTIVFGLMDVINFGHGAFVTIGAYMGYSVLAEVILASVLLRMIWVANSLDLILVMTGGGPGTATQTLPLHAFLTAWSGGNYGQGSALAVFLTLILLCIVAVMLWRRRET